MERLDKIKGHIVHIILMLSRRTGLVPEQIQADINERTGSGGWEAGFPYWAEHEKLPFIPYNGMKELNEQEQVRLYAGFCSVAGGILASLARAIEEDDLDAAIRWAEEQVIELAWLGGTIASVWGEKERSQKTGAMTGALNAKPIEKYQRTSDVYWIHMTELKHDLNARIQTGIDIAQEEGRSKPLSAEAIRKRLDKLHQMT